MGKDSPKHSIDIHVLDCSVLLTLPAESSRLLQKRQNAGEKNPWAAGDSCFSLCVFR